MSLRWTLIPAACLALLALHAGARAQPAPANLWDRSHLLGDPLGLRTALGRAGITLGVQETSEVLGNVTGGLRRGADYEGLTEMSLGLDTKRAFGWSGGIFNVSALQVHGRNLSTDNLDTLQTASGIEANRATRLWELWYQQAFFGGRVDVKLGQQSIDNEFITSQGSSLFVNTMMGWPMVPSADLYAGGPAYPLSSLGVRLRAHPTKALTILAGVFDDNPPGGPFANDSQLRGAEAAGLAFSRTTGALWIAELDDRHRPADGLDGTYKLGFWYDSGSFPDQHYDSAGVSLASPASDGVPRMHRGNGSLYGVVDQTIWRPGPKSPRALAVFLRVMGAPADRNLISFSANGGLTLSDPFPGQDNDTAGIGFGVAKLSGAVAALDKDTGLFTGSTYPVQGTEAFVELTYQMQITPWWQVQPDFQYVIAPGGGVPDPLDPSRPVGNEVVLGLRTVITVW